MAVTLNLVHTVSTRVVWTTADIEEARKELEVTLGEMDSVLQRQTLTPKQHAQVRAAMARAEHFLSQDDEGMVLELVKAGFRLNLRKDMKETLDLIGVTRMSPVQTVVVV